MRLHLFHLTSRRGRAGAGPALGIPVPDANQTFPAEGLPPSPRACALIEGAWRLSGEHCPTPEMGTDHGIIQAARGRHCWHVAVKCSIQLDFGEPFQKVNTIHFIKNVFITSTQENP